MSASLSRIAFAAVVAGAIASTGCGGPDRGAVYVRAMAAGDQAETAGKYAEAAAKYDEAAGGAKITRDRNHARYLAGRSLARSGNLRDAATRLRAIADASPPQEDSAEAAYALIEMKIARGEDARADLESLVVRFQSSGVARTALRKLVRQDDEAGGPSRALEHLRAIQAKLDRSEVGETVSYEIALRLAELGEKPAARDAFLATADRWPYPKGAFWDDSLFHASEIEEGLGNYPAAVADLERMLRERESSSFMGTYERPRYTPAMLRLAVLYRDRLHDRKRARDTLHALYTDFPTALDRDDALWEEARLWREDGDTGKSCDCLASLANDFPSSRYVPCAKATCPTIRTSPDAGAPAECHPYLLRGPRIGVEEPK